MFIGHYAPALTAGAHGKIKLWQAFVAVQFLDFAWAGLNLAGIEKTHIVEGFAGNNPLDLYYMPYTHSLGMSLIWAVGAAFLFALAFRKQALTGAILFGVLVFSHWVLDLIVHKPDLALWFGTSKVGFGLWEKPWLANILELGLFLAGMIWYLSKTVATGTFGKYYPIVFIALFASIHAVSQTMPVPSSVTEATISAIVSFIVMVLLAVGLDTTRRQKNSVR
jgi:hypothetical protein